MKRVLNFSIYILCLSIFMYGCGSLAQPTATPAQAVNLPLVNSDPAYPAPDQASNPEDSVLPTPILEVNGPNFSIEPLKAGDTVIRGTGPQGLVIDVIDVSRMGQLLEKVTIDSNGSFEINLDTPLEGQRLIAIALPLDARASVDALNLLREKGGERPRHYPDVGYVYDSEIVQK